MSISRAERTSRRVARPLDWFSTLTKPFTLGLNKVSNSILRLFGIRPGELEEQPTTEDLKLPISQSAIGGELDPGEAGMLSGVFHLHEQEAREVMTPIPAVVTVDYSSSVSEALELCWSSGYNRLVVVEDGNQDRVRGIAHALRLTKLLMGDGPETAIALAVREALIVPETKALDDLLTELQRQRSSMGVVVDEYGRTVGVVTVEDILEEVVGEIEDETDPLAGSLRQLANGDWYARPRLARRPRRPGHRAAGRHRRLQPVGGYVFGELGRLLKRGDLITADGFEIRVESVRENRIEAVRIHSLRAQNAGPGPVRGRGTASRPFGLAPVAGERGQRAQAIPARGPARAQPEGRGRMVGSSVPYSHCS